MAEMVGPTSHYFYSQRLKLHYVDWGNPEKPPLLLIHGGRDHARNWDWVAQDLRRDYHIIAPDLRGHGDSQWAIGVELRDGRLHARRRRSCSTRSASFRSPSSGTRSAAPIALQYTGTYPERVKQGRRDRGARPAVRT